MSPASTRVLNHSKERSVALCDAAITQTPLFVNAIHEWGGVQVLHPKERDVGILPGGLLRGGAGLKRWPE